MGTINVSDYDASAYDYTKYWKGRDYEHACEVQVLSKFLPERGQRILDVGGSFGRLTSVYQPIFDEAVIVDYSRKSLQQAQDLAKQKGWKNVKTEVGDVYELPFEDNRFDCIIMVRVMHHLEDPNKALSELARVLKPGGTLILETANKIHLKAVLRALKGGQFRFRSDQTPIQHSTMTIGGQSGIFYNFHPRHIQEMLIKIGFKVQNKQSGSNLRIGVLKKLFPTQILVFLDTLIQPLATPLSLGPSIWWQCRKV